MTDDHISPYLDLPFWEERCSDEVSWWESGVVPRIGLKVLRLLGFLARFYVVMWCSWAES